MTDDLIRVIPRLDEFLATPGGPAALRRLVLAHAFSGQLRTTGDSGENADRILERIITSSRVGDGKKAHTDFLVPTDEAPYPLPYGWKWVRLSVLCSHIADCLHRTPKYSTAGYPAIRTNDMRPGRILLETARRVSKEEYQRQTRRLLPKAGDVFYSREGNYGMAAVVPEGTEICLSQRMMQFRLHDGIDPAYFSWALNSPVLFDQAKRSVTGTTVPHVNIKALKRFAFPLAPTAEQRRIVEWVEGAMDLIDRLEAAQLKQEEQRRRLARSAFRELSRRADTFALDHLGELIRNPSDVQDFGEAIIGLALTGQLGEPAVEGENADTLLEKIAMEKRARGLKGDIATLEPDGSFVLAAGWRLVVLGDILAHCRNGTSAKPNDLGVGYRLLRISASTSRRDGVVDLSDHKYAELSEDQAGPYFVRPGDLLVCRFNGNLHYVGKASQVPAEVPRPTLHPDKLICLRAILVSHSYLRYVMNSWFVRRQIEDVAATTAGNIGINGKQLKAIVVPLAPLAEQERIVKRLDEAFILLDRLAPLVA